MTISAIRELNYKIDWSNDESTLFFYIVSLTKGPEINRLRFYEVCCNRVEKCALNRHSQGVEIETKIVFILSFGFFRVLVVPFNLKALVNLMVLVL